MGGKREHLGTVKAQGLAAILNRLQEKPDWEDLIQEGDKGANHADTWRKSKSDISVPDVVEK